jgi:hypothetical protein
LRPVYAQAAKITEQPKKSLIIAQDFDRCVGLHRRT